MKHKFAEDSSRRYGWIFELSRRNIIDKGNSPEAELTTIRSNYERLVDELRVRASEMRASGEEIESIARTIHEERRILTATYKELTPEPLRTQIYERTVSAYGDRLGPTIEFLRSKGKSWNEIIESATRHGVVHLTSPSNAANQVLSFTSRSTTLDI